MGSNPKRWDRATALVLLLALLAGAVAAWLFAGRIDDARAEERRELNLRLETSSAGWAEATDRFFSGAETAARLIDSLSDELADEDQRVTLLAEVVRSQPALDAAFVGYPNGDFEFVARPKEPNETGFRTRRITAAPNREVVETRLTDTLDVLSFDDEVESDYDPRLRPWYLPIGEKDRWTEPYTFASSGAPGITYSMRVGEPESVIGIDMKLTELNLFLAELAPESRAVDDEVDRVDEEDVEAEDVEAEDVEVEPQLAGTAVLVAVNEASPFSEELTVLATSVAGSEPHSLAEVEGLLQHGMSLQSIVDEFGEDPKLTDFIVQRSDDGTRTLVARPARADRPWFLIVQAVDDAVLSESASGPTGDAAGIALMGLAAAALVGALGLWFNGYRRTLKNEADRDELTGLLSRRAIQRKLKFELRNDDPVTVGIVDLDRFKAVNDDNGHLVGDAVLTSVAKRIAVFAEEHGGAAGRLGGDEFAIVTTRKMNWQGMAAMLDEPVRIESGEYSLGGSIGIASSASKPDATPEDLIRAADRALFSVKRQGGGGYAIDGEAPTVYRVNTQPKSDTVRPTG